jgi:hypothetical protein
MSEAASSGSCAPAPGPRRRERLLLVGFTSCDRVIAERLMAAGRMPNLARLRAEGVWGQVLASEPLLAPALWTTVATGRNPMAHDVLTPWAARPDGGGVGPVGRPSWHAPAFWQILEAAGRRTITVGWPATAPATDWPGVHVDARFAVATGPDFATWAVPRGAVSPATMLPSLRELRVHPTDMEGAMVAPFVPRIAEIDQYRESGLTKLAVMLAAVSTVHAVATELLATQDWDAAAVHYDWLDPIQRSFLSHGAESRFGGVVDAAYNFADALLGRLMALAGEDTTLWVMSPNGVRLSLPPGGAAQTLSWRGTGFIAARGRWIAGGQTLAPVRLADIAPSLLARFGLVAEMDGKRLSALAPGQSRRTVTVPAMKPPAPDRHVAALKSLGYDDTPSEAQAAALTRAEAAGLIAQGEVLLAAGRLADAERALLAARAMLPPDNPSGLQRLALCRLMRNDAAGCRAIGETLRRIAPEAGWGDLIVAAGHALAGDAAAARPLMAAAEAKGGGDPDLVNRLGGIALLLNDADTATAHFTSALALDPEMHAAREGLAMARELRSKA